MLAAPSALTSVLNNAVSLRAPDSIICDVHGSCVRWVQFGRTEDDQKVSETPLYIDRNPPQFHCLQICKRVGDSGTNAQCADQYCTFAHTEQDAIFAINLYEKNYPYPAGHQRAELARDSLRGSGPGMTGRQWLLRRTQLCKSVILCTECEYGQGCTYAHKLPDAIRAIKRCYHDLNEDNSIAFPGGFRKEWFQSQLQSDLHLGTTWTMRRMRKKSWMITCAAGLLWHLRLWKIVWITPQAQFMGFHLEKCLWQRRRAKLFLA